MCCVHETREVDTSQLIMMSLLGILWAGSLSVVLAGMQDVGGKVFPSKWMPRSVDDCFVYVEFDPRKQSHGNYSVRRPKRLPFTPRSFCPGCTYFYLFPSIDCRIRTGDGRWTLAAIYLEDPAQKATFLKMRNT